MCLVSVVIPYFNNEATIIRAIKSVVAQTFNDYEIILVNDGSTDQSGKLVNEFLTRNAGLRAVNLTQQNKGPSIARNVGIERAAGEFIAFLDADDEWLPEKLEKQIPLMQAHSIDLLGCNYYIVSEDVQTEFRFVQEPLKQISFGAALFKHYFATPCVVVRKAALLDLGMFPENQHYMEDAYLFTSFARKYKACMMGEFLVKVFKLPYGQSGLSARLLDMERNELLNLKRFRTENDRYERKLSLATYLAAGSFSLLKYIRRVLVTKVRNT